MKGRIHRQSPADDNRIGLPRVGTLKIGLKNDKGTPMSVDYFIPTGKYAALFTAAYGDRPQSIQIIFPDDDPAKVCNEYYEYRDDKGRLIAFGDGDIFNIWNGAQYQIVSVADYPNVMQSVAKRYPNRDTKGGGDGWRATLTLSFFVPMVQGVAGVWQFVTKGVASTIPNLRDTFDTIRAERGFVKGIIFDLNVAFAKSQKPDSTSRYPVVTLVPNQSRGNVEKVREALKPINLLGNGDE